MKKFLNHDFRYRLAIKRQAGVTTARLARPATGAPTAAGTLGLQLGSSGAMSPDASAIRKATQAPRPQS